MAPSGVGLRRVMAGSADPWGHVKDLGRALGSDKPFKTNNLHVLLLCYRHV